MSDLVRMYREYYREQTPRAFEDLFRCMLDYDFASYHDDMRRVYAMHQQVKCLGSSCSLKSGGSSTGVGRTYQFGPNFQIARVAIEGFLRESHRRTIILAGSEGLKDPQVQDVSRPSQYDLQILGDWSLDGHIEFLFDQINVLFSEYGPINLCALPCLWLKLTCNPTFVSLAEKRSESLNALVNTDNSRCFRKIRCRVRDQMIDWGSGVNFYTCAEGKSHFLPTFFSSSPRLSYSLVNLKKSMRESDDLVEIRGSPSLCPCGLPDFSMLFTPHVNNHPVLSDGSFLGIQEVLDALPDRTEWFQVLQNDDGFCDLFYYSKERSSDLSAVDSRLSELLADKIRWDFDRYFVVGRKRPVCWRGGSPAVHDGRKK